MSRANVADAGLVPITRTSARTMADTKPSLSADGMEPGNEWRARDGTAGELRSMRVSSCGGTREIRAYAARLAALSPLPEEPDVAGRARGRIAPTGRAC